MPTTLNRDRWATFCRDRGIVRLSVFGSVLRDDFDPARSDIDVLVDFKPEAMRGIGVRFFGYGDELASSLGAVATQASRSSRSVRRPRKRHPSDTCAHFLAITSDQAAVCLRRRYIPQPPQAIPASPITHVDGSGTATTPCTEKLPLLLS